jgi:hypothetical protein
MAADPLEDTGLPSLLTQAERLLASRLELSEPIAAFAPLTDRLRALLGGAYLPGHPRHRAIALGLAGALARRWATERGAFWFAQRELPFGGALGFPGALLVVEPIALVEATLAQGTVADLDDRQEELARAMGEATTGQLSPKVYEALHDPGFVEFCAVDPSRLAFAWSTPVEGLLTALAEGIRGAQGLRPDEAERLEDLWIERLRALDRGRPLKEQVASAQRLAEGVGWLFAAVAVGLPAAEEFWADELFAELKAGANLPGERVLGVFPAEALQPLHAALGVSASPRFIGLDPEPLRPLLAHPTRPGHAAHVQSLRSVVEAATRIGRLGMVRLTRFELEQRPATQALRLSLAKQPLLAG